MDVRLGRRTALGGAGLAAVAAAGAGPASAEGSHGRGRLSVLQLNVWHAGGQVEGGRQGVADTIATLTPDIATFSESSPAQLDSLVQDLAARGLAYEHNAVDDHAVLARHPIVDHASMPGWSKAVLDVGGTEVAAYSGHLEYRWYAAYLPRGYGAGVPEPGATSQWGWEQIPEGPVTDVDLVLRVNRASGRTEATRRMIADAREERARGRLVVAGGDLNEPSHRDWTRATRRLFDHHGAVVPWQTTRALERAGFRDTYREAHPDPVRHPGFTWPSDNPGAEVDELTWTPTADERDRIDYVLYRPDRRLRLLSSTVVGPRTSIVRSRRVPEPRRKRIIEPSWVWPSDHKGVLARFALR